jgi:hypothetical protein
MAEMQRNGRALPAAAPLPPPNIRTPSTNDVLVANAPSAKKDPFGRSGSRSSMPRLSVKKDALLRLQPAPDSQAPEVSTKTLLSYAAPTLGLDLANAVQGGPVLTLYTDLLGLPLGTYTVATAAAQCIELVAGFALGYATDTMRSRFGRRRPFIVVGALLSAFGMLGIARPPAGLALRHSATDAAHHAANSTDACTAYALAANCTATAHCLHDALAADTLPPWHPAAAVPDTSTTDSTAMPSLGDDAAASSSTSDALPPATFGLALWLFVTFLARAIGRRSVFGLAYVARDGAIHRADTPGGWRHEHSHHTHTTPTHAPRLS